MERITIEDVASTAGVSVTTVSHVFSGKRPVKEATRVHVEQVARKMGYRPNAIAASLRAQRTHTAMIVIPDISNPFYPALARGVQDALRKGGYHTLLCNTDGDERVERVYVDDARSGRVDGLIFMGFHVPIDDLSPLANAGIAVVNLGYGETDAPIDAVRSDDRASASQAASYLLKHSPGSVALIDGDTTSHVGQERLRGFLDAYASMGLEVPEGFVVTTDFTRSGGQRGLKKLLALPAPPRAVFCANDLIALGAIDTARNAQLRIPEDLAIMGCDDIDAAQIVTPRLTTVRNGADRIGKACGELLLSRMTGEYTGPGREVVIPHEVVLRESA